MIDGTVPFIAFCLSLREHLGGGSLDSVKRKLRLLIRLVRCGKVSDPLSSMSSPPSPPRIPHHEPVSSIRDAQVSASAAPRSSPSPMSTLALAATAPASPFYDPIRRHYEIDRPLPGHALHMPSAHQQEQASHNIPGPSTFQPGPYSLQPTSQPFVQSASSTSSVHHSTSSRGGRKSKAHVASACINCKRAHLSCDVGRPCTRCVASGKQVRALYASTTRRPTLTRTLGQLRRRAAQKARPTAITRGGRVQGRAISSTSSVLLDDRRGKHHRSITTNCCPSTSAYRVFPLDPLTRQRRLSL